MKLADFQNVALSLVIASATVLAGCSPNEGPASARAAEESGTGEKPETVLAFTSMVGVEGPFVDSKRIRGVQGDELPWEIATADGLLTSDGHLRLAVTGVVFGDYPEVPPELRGINDDDEFRALVSCLRENDHGHIERANMMTEGFPATTTGDSNIDAMVDLSEGCVAPIVFVMAGDEDFWFAVTGFEGEEEEEDGGTCRGPCPPL